MWRPAAIAGVFLALSPAAALACIAPPHEMTQMPETLVRHDGTGIYAAWYDNPTDRYGHGVLGDRFEPTTLTAYSPTAANTCRILGVTLDADHVFEDVAPRLQDLDGDGAAEIIVVRSHARLGAQLAVYGDAGDGMNLRLIAATPYIGQSSRWLAPVGAADLNGDGLMEIAFVDRPHLARILRVWTYFPDGRLEQIASLGGLTNHRIGEDFITGGIRDCGGTPEIVTADTGWSQVMITTLTGDNDLSSRAVAPYSEEALRAALDCRIGG